MPMRLRRRQSRLLNYYTSFCSGNVQVPLPSLGIGAASVLLACVHEALLFVGVEGLAHLDAVRDVGHEPVEEEPHEEHHVLERDGDREGL